MKIAYRTGLLVLVTVVLWSFATLSAAAPAWAHAALVASSPTELQILSDPPRELLLVFDEGVDPALSTIRVTGPGTMTAVVGSLSHGTQGDSYLQASLSGRLAAGDHRVDWRAVSTDDGHPTFGSFSFRTLTAADLRPEHAPAPRARTTSGSGASAAVFGVARWLAFLAFTLLVGACYFLVACWPEGGSRRGWQRLVCGSWWALLVATFVQLISYGPSVERAPLGKVTDLLLLNATLASRTGHVLVIRLALLAVVGTVAVALRWRARSSSWGRRRLVRPVVLAWAATLAVTWSAVSHSDSSPHSTPMVALDVVHLVVAAVWLGGLVTLGLVLLGKVDDPAVTRVAMTRFSSTALVCVVLLVGTGCVQAWQRVGTLDALTDNSYARLLLTKLALVAMTLLLAGVARSRLLRPRTRTRRTVPERLRRVVLAEAGLGVAVLTVTSLLVATNPARAAHAQLVADRHVVSNTVRSVAKSVTPLSGQVPYDAGTGSSGRGIVDVGVAPPAVGPTEVHLTFLNATGAPQPLAVLTALLRPVDQDQEPTVVRLSTVSPGHYVSTGATFPFAGPWQLGLAFQLPNHATATALVSVTVT